MINIAHLLGRVGKIETQTLSNGINLTNFSLVTSKKITKNGVKEEKATWHSISAFGKLSDIASQYLNVGDLVFVSGEIENHKYTTQDGLEKFKNYILANNIKLMPRTKEKPQANHGVIEDDPIPF